MNAKMLLLLFLNNFKHATPRNNNKNNFAFICCKFVANLCKFSEILEQCYVKLWLNYRKYGSVSYSFSCIGFDFRAKTALLNGICQVQISKYFCCLLTFIKCWFRRKMNFRTATLLSNIFSLLLDFPFGTILSAEFINGYCELVDCGSICCQGL